MSQSRPGQIVVVGDLVTDVVAHLSQPPALGSDASASVRTTGGGSGANVAAWLAAQGCDVAFVGRVGDDSSGRMRVAELAALGVEVQVAVDESAPTGTVVVVVSPDGQRTMLPDRGANLRLVAGDLPPGLFAERRHLHLSGYTLLDPRPRPAGLQALAAAREANMTVSVDPSSTQPLIDVGPAAFLQWTAGADVCLPNADEALALTGAQDPNEAAAKLATHYGEVVVTLGAAGAVWAAGDEVVRAPASDAPAVDTTGAGDAFAAGYLQGYLSGEPVPARLARGMALAATAVARVGARPPDPRRT